jgi:hypothetical protein
MNICICFYFLLFKRQTYYNEEKFPLKVAFTLSIISITVSTIFSTVGFSNAVSRAFLIILNNYIFVYVFWRVIRKKEDVIFLVKGFTYIFIVLGLYGFYEKITGMNPLIAYEIALNPLSKVFDWRYDDFNRLGMGRVSSAIIHPIGFGVYLGIVISFYLFIQHKFREIWETKLYMKMLLFFLCTCCLFFTNSRSPIIYLFIAVFPIFNLKEKRTYQILFVMGAGIIIAWNFIVPYLANIISLYAYDTSSIKEVGGSSLNMRIIQFSTTFEIFSKSPFIGLGIKSLDNMLGMRGLYGAESIWMLLLIERGVLGVISYITLIVSILKIGFDDIKYFIWGMTLAWLAVETVTSTPGIEISFFITIIFILNRIQILFEQKEIQYHKNHINKNDFFTY